MQVLVYQDIQIVCGPVCVWREGLREGLGEGLGETGLHVEPLCQCMCSRGSNSHFDLPQF